MPLLWTNKNRVNRVFQIVADLHSSKRSSSFAVQTGFPTSLIDLLIKNRTRFTNPKSNKPFQTQTSDPPPPETPSFNDCKVDCAEPDHTDSQNLTQLITDENLHVNDDVVLNSDQGVTRVGKSNDGSGSKSVLGIFLMMFITVVSIASFEKLTVGVTVSALVLLFLEYAVLCSKPKEEIKVVLTDSLSFEEIKVVGVSSEDTSSCDGVKLDCVKEDKKLECSEKVVDSCKVSLHEKNKVNNSVKFKSMLKKLLGQKFQRSSRKEEKEECKVESRSGEDGCSNNFEKDFELKEEVVVVDSGSKSPLLLNVKPEDMRVTSEVKRVDSVGNSDYMILFGIALVGLVMGRFPALILTMTWCLMVKIAAVRGRSKKPLIKSCVPNS